MRAERHGSNACLGLGGVLLAPPVNLRLDVDLRSIEVDVPLATRGTRSRERQ
jgi:hypothetical protein